MPPFTLPNVDVIYSALIKLLRILFILIFALLASRFIHRVVRGFRIRMVSLMQKGAQTPDIELEKRGATLGGIVRKTASVILWTVAGIMALKEAGFDVAPILAGAGVVGLAVGFGAQNLVRDVIAGLFILVENQIRVKDVAIVNGTGGLVEEINLRTTVFAGIRRNCSHLSERRDRAAFQYDPRVLLLCIRHRCRI